MKKLALFLPLVFFGLSCTQNEERSSRLSAAKKSAPVESGQAELQTWLDRNIASVVETYKHLHQNPELSLQEKKTSARLAKDLRDMGYQVSEKIGGYGVVGLLENGTGPILMLRADMDALPIEENTPLTYASKQRTTDRRGREVSLMHACGHDIHMANMIGVAGFMAEHRSLWKGKLMIVFQPAEEIGRGAKMMLEDGLFEKFIKPDYALALHTSPSSSAGTVGFKKGFFLANVDSVDITMRGKGGHGAYPHKTIDPVVMSSQLVMDLQTIVAREVSPLSSAVVTVGSFHCGTKHNIIPNECKLQLTVRSQSQTQREALHEAIERKAKAVSAAYRAPEPRIRFSEGVGALSNDAALVDIVAEPIKVFLGEDKVLAATPQMGGEDFSQYGAAGVPSMMFWVGTVAEDRLRRLNETPLGPHPLHSALYYPDPEPTLKTAITAMTAASLALLRGENR